MTEHLHPSERVAILQKRLDNLLTGAGEYTELERGIEIELCSVALFDAKEELRRLH